MAPRAAALTPSALPAGGRPARRRRPPSGKRAVRLQTQPGHHRRGPGDHLLALRDHQKVAPSARMLPPCVSELRHCVVVLVVCSCEIIRDWKSGDSLCYAFIEFDKVRSVPAPPQGGAAERPLRGLNSATLAILQGATRCQHSLILGPSMNERSQRNSVV